MEGGAAMKRALAVSFLLGCCGYLLADANTAPPPRQVQVLQEIVRLTHTGASEDMVLAFARAHRQELPSKAAILEAFDVATRQAREWMHKSNAEYEAPWTLARGGHVVFSMPRVLAFRSFVVSHMIHHRGQLSVYLSMTGAAVPPIYGPSADEGN